MDHRTFAQQYYDDPSEDQDELANYLEEEDEDGMWTRFKTKDFDIGFLSAVSGLFRTLEKRFSAVVY